MISSKRYMALRQASEAILFNTLKIIMPSMFCGLLVFKFLFVPGLFVINPNPSAGLVILFALVFWLGATCLIADWVVRPLLGLHYLRCVERDYGPKTRQKVLEWFEGEGEHADTDLDLDRLGRKLGEPCKS